jgi:GTP cyclohydrolase I
VADIDRARAAVAELLAALGIPEGDHTRDTPARVARAWGDAVAGYDSDPALHLKVRFPGPPECGLVVVAGIHVISTCAHHLLPITGTATVAYRPRPGDPLVGLSKLARLVDGYARRLQVQEQLGYQVATALQQHLDPLGAACLITAVHGCMSLRGIADHGARTTTYAFSGHLAAEDVARVQAQHLTQ